MASSKYDVCSQSLGLLREGGITSFSDGTNSSDICGLFYDDWVRDVLTRYPWSFATKKRALNQDSTAPVNEYQYSHILPAECLKLWAVFDSDEVNARTLTEYDVQQVGNSRRIYSNFENLWVDYTVYVPESSWPAYFVHFAIHALAALIAQPVTDQTDLAESMQVKAYGMKNENEKGGKYAVATGIDALQKPGEQINSSPLIDARFG